MTGDGQVDANDVAQDAEDNIIGNEDSPIDLSLARRYPNLGKGTRVGDIARQEELERLEAEHEEKDYLRREGGYTGRQGELPESTKNSAYILEQINNYMKRQAPGRFVSLAEIQQMVNRLGGR
jgi:hypothetical protein